MNPHPIKHVRNFVVGFRLNPFKSASILFMFFGFNPIKCAGGFVVLLGLCSVKCAHTLCPFWPLSNRMCTQFCCDFCLYPTKSCLQFFCAFGIYPMKCARSFVVVFGFDQWNVHAVLSRCAFCDLSWLIHQLKCFPSSARETVWLSQCKWSNSTQCSKVWTVYFVLWMYLQTLLQWNLSITTT